MGPEVSNLEQGDRAPTAVSVPITTGAVNGTTVTRVRLRVRYPDGTFLDKDLTPSSSTTTSVTCSWLLASDGGDLPQHGPHLAGAFLYGAADAYLGDAHDVLFHVDPRKIPFP